MNLPMGDLAERREEYETTGIDVGDTEGPAKIELFDQNGNSITSTTAPDGENNGLAKIVMPANQNVWKMIITMHGSGSPNSPPQSDSRAGFAKWKRPNDAGM